jgi:hypothetical protein
MVGIAMGSNCSPWVANLSLCFYELEFDRNLHLRFPSFMSRYIDDVLVPHLPGLDPLPLLLEIYAPSGLGLTRSDTFNSNCVFLDIQFPTPQTTNLFSFGLYCKPGTNFEYPHFNSFIPRSIPTGLVIGGFHRIFNRNSHLDQFKIAWDRYSSILIQRGYPKAWVIKTLRVHFDSKSPDPKLVDYHFILDFQPHLHLPTLHSIIKGHTGKHVSLALRQHPNTLRWSKKTYNNINCPKGPSEATRDVPNSPLTSIQLIQPTISLKRHLPVAEIFSKLPKFQ